METLDILEGLKKEFPADQVRKREGNKKKNPETGQYETQWFDYIPTNFVSERLDSVLGLNWSWQVLETKEYAVTKSSYNKATESYTSKQVMHVAVLGRLLIHLPDNNNVFRDAWGGCELDKGGQAGDCYKIADSNAFKKAAYKFGVGGYLGIAALENSDLREDMNQRPAKNSFRKTNNGTPKSKNPFLA